MHILSLIFKEVLYLSAMACVLVMLLLALKRLFRKALSAKWQYCLWAVLVLRLLVPFQPPSALSVYNVFYAAAESANLPVTAFAEPRQYETPAQEASVSEPDSAGPAAQNGTTGSPALSTGISGSSVQEEGENRALGAAESFFKAAPIIWLAGMAALAMYTAAVNLTFAASVRRRYVPLRDDRIGRVLDDSLALLHIRRRIPILTTDMARTPALYGLLRPKILVCAASMEQLGDNELRHVFLHELSHYKRKDIAVNWLLTVLRLVHFFNPLVWYAFHKIREDGEAACDEAALRYIRPEERLSYGNTVIKLLRLFSESSFIPVTAGLSKNKQSVKRRILMIGNFKKSRWTGTLLAVLLLAAAALAGLTGCSETAGTATPDNSPESSVSGNPADTASPGASAPDASAPDMSTSPSGTQTPDETANPSPSSSPSPSEAAPSSEPVPSPVPSEAPMPSSGPTAEPVPSSGTVDILYSDWTVAKVLAYGTAGTYSKEDAEALIGQTLSFSKGSVTIINDQPSSSPGTYKNPEYTEDTVSKNDFITDFNMSFDKLGLSAESASLFTVSVSGAGGCVLLVKDADTLILYAGGTFFELTRSE
jgi:beta-lactamase regulating signal transducer with metallopeptidase domain